MASSLVITFSKAGQRYPTPSPGAGQRVFYESLWNEKQLASPMSLIYMIENGCFPAEQAEALQPQYLAAKKKGGAIEAAAAAAAPVVAAAASAKKAPAKAASAKKGKVVDADGDLDVANEEGMGTTSL